MIKANIALLLVIGLHAVAADYSTCVRLLAAQVKDGDLNCGKIEPYAKCVLRETRFTTSTMSTAIQVKRIKTLLNNGIARYGLSCKFDFESLVQQMLGQSTLRRKVRDGSATDYNRATTPTECLNVYIRHKSIDCSEITPFLKCVLRVKGIAKYASYITDSEMQELQTQMNNDLSQLGLHCNVNLKSVLNDINNNNSGSVSSYRPFHIYTLITLISLSAIFLY